MVWVFHFRISFCLLVFIASQWSTEFIKYFKKQKNSTKEQKLTDGSQFQRQKNKTKFLRIWEMVRILVRFFSLLCIINISIINLYFCSHLLHLLIFNWKSALSHHRLCFKAGSAVWFHIRLVWKKLSKLFMQSAMFPAMKKNTEQLCTYCKRVTLLPACQNANTPFWRNSHSTVTHIELCGSERKAQKIECRCK